MKQEELILQIIETMNYSRTEEEIIEHCQSVGITLEEYRDSQLRGLEARRKDNPNYPGQCPKGFIPEHLKSKNNHN